MRTSSVYTLIGATVAWLGGFVCGMVCAPALQSSQNRTGSLRAVHPAMLTVAEGGMQSMRCCRPLFDTDGVKDDCLWIPPATDLLVIRESRELCNISVPGKRTANGRKECAPDEAVWLNLLRWPGAVPRPSLVPNVAYDE